MSLTLMIITFMGPGAIFKIFSIKLCVVDLEHSDWLQKF